MATWFFKGMLFHAILGILEKRFPEHYSKMVEEKAKKSSAYFDMQVSLKEIGSQNEQLQIRVMGNQSARETMRKDMEEQRVYYQGQLANQGIILEKQRQYHLATIIQGVIDSKKMRGLENLIAHQRARINRDKNDFPQVIASVFEKPPYRKISFILVHNKGQVYYQNSASRKQVGDLKGRNLSGYLDCANPNKQKVVLGGKDYTAYVFPLSGGRAFDYSAVFLKSASVFERLRYKSGRQMDRALEVIKAEMAALDAKLDEKAQMTALNAKLDKKARHQHHGS